MVPGVWGGDGYMKIYTGLSPDVCIQACRHEEDCVAVSSRESEGTPTCLLYAEETFANMQDSTATSVFLNCPQSECSSVEHNRQINVQSNLY